MERRHFDGLFPGHTDLGGLGGQGKHRSRLKAVDESQLVNPGTSRSHHPQHHSLANEVGHRHLPRPIMGCHHRLSGGFPLWVTPGACL